MKLVATARAAPDAEAAARALAEAAGIAPAEARMRLAPEPPALLARLDDAAAGALVAKLRAAGLAALAVEARAPSDRDRTRARTFAIGPQLTFTPRFGDPLALAPGDVLAVLRGLRAVRSEVERTEKSKSFSLGMAIATQGLKTSKTSEKTVRTSAEETEQVILVMARDGREASLAEGELDFSCLGGAMQPSRTANLMEVWRRLVAATPAAFHDERLVRLGRRALPFVVSESRASSGGVAKTRVDTASTVDVIAEVLRQALLQGLLP